MPKPACPKCQRFFRPKTNGYAFIEGMPIQADAEPGTSQPELWKPYKLWVCDLWECEGCGAEILTGYGRGPVSEHYQPDFDSFVASFGATLQINDC
jgi:hypothetical protein